MIVQKELLLDVLDTASCIEEEFSSVFIPYEKGWYRRQETKPFMPALNKKGEPLFYHMKGGTLLAPWDEQITLVTDPNTAERSVYDQDGNKVLDIQLPISTKHFHHPPRHFFTQRPALPVHGVAVILEYVRWILDQACLWQSSQPPLGEYLKRFIEPTLLEEAEVLEVDYTLLETKAQSIPKKVSAQTVPTVLRSNTLLDALTERLYFHCQSLHQTLGTFIGPEEWQTYSVQTKAHIHLFVRKLGDYRILEWTRLKEEGKI